MKTSVNIPHEINRTLNIVKYQHKLKNKSEALKLIVRVYKIDYMGAELRSQFVEKMNKLAKEKGIPFKSIDELRKRYSGQKRKRL